MYLKTALPCCLSPPWWSSLSTQLSLIRHLDIDIRDRGTLADSPIRMGTCPDEFGNHASTRRNIRNQRAGKSECIRCRPTRSVSFFCLIDVKIKKIFQIKIKPSTFLARQKVIIRFWIAALKVLAKRRWAVGTINWASILTRAIGVF